LPLSSSELPNFALAPSKDLAVSLPMLPSGLLPEGRSSLFQKTTSLFAPLSSSKEPDDGC